MPWAKDPRRHRRQARLRIINTALFAIFAISFFHPRTRRDWRAMGGFTAFLVAVFTEMSGVPLTVYLLSSWLGSKVPALSATHAGGHLFNDLIGWNGDPTCHHSTWSPMSSSVAGSGWSPRRGGCCSTGQGAPGGDEPSPTPIDHGSHHS